MHRKDKLEGDKTPEVVHRKSKVEVDKVLGHLEADNLADIPAQHHFGADTLQEIEEIP
ncbi:hypothetical protein AGMMS49949_04900 [Alphaproteobacteria bacterium]|nr:hypothetical protein AGMMS49949_04900 [Alphaproteobacteria bacterium]GHS96473.1 hypothetical protein AGMMS50296_2640 [Alphaproteobacteria bacterium]